ncbi:uncharacterized protein LOC134585372 [Pelobates fuscus]|uniref:uncharacterized protein LOC134585372 n=1 Tax=Pelobates fuscus TaxID=191477 RepID=UPI002FE42CC5
MAFQVQNLSVLFLLLSYWSLTTTGFTPNEIGNINDYITRTFTINNQFACVIKFTETECGDLTADTIRNALENDKNRINIYDIINGVIHEGERMVMASFFRRPDGSGDHAEHRLLTPVNNSPVLQLLNRAPPAGCVIFFSKYSPCYNYCTVPNGPLSIITKLNQFNKVTDINNKAFVFNNIYNKELNIDAQLQRERFKAINDHMLLYRCPNQNCIQCFPNNNFNANCVN